MRCFLLIAFDTPAKMTKAVMAQEVDGILIDNYALTRFSKMMEKESIRVERTIEHPITYGLVLPTGSPNTTQCVRRYMDNFNHEIFEHIAKHLKPIKVRYANAIVKYYWAIIPLETVTLREQLQSLDNFRNCLEKVRNNF